MLITLYNYFQINFGISKLLPTIVWAKNISLQITNIISKLKKLAL